VAASPVDRFVSDELVTLEELAVPFTSRLCEHLTGNDKQGTSGSSRFLDACRAFNRGELDEEVLLNRTVALGFNNVIDARAGACSRSRRDTPCAVVRDLR
jgi:hypothetical protein